MCYFFSLPWILPLYFILMLHFKNSCAVFPLFLVLVIFIFQVFILFLPWNPFLTSILFRYSCHFTCKFSCSVLLVFLMSSPQFCYVFLYSEYFFQQHLLSFIIISLDYARVLCHKPSLMFCEAGELKYSNTQVIIWCIVRIKLSFSAIYW